MAGRTYPSIFESISMTLGEFRWRFQSANHKTTADGSEGYGNYNDCRDGISILDKAIHGVSDKRGR